MLSENQHTTLKWILLASGCGLLLLLIWMWASWVPYLDQMDKQLMVQLNFEGGSFADGFWFIFSQNKLAWTPFALAGIYSLYRYNNVEVRNKIFLILATALLVTILDRVSSGLIKGWVARLRPSHTAEIMQHLHYVNDYYGGQFGFVSSHAANMVGLCTWLCLFFKDRFARFTFIFFTVLMCYSRIYLGVHYPGDILCGALLGFVVAYGMHHLYCRYLPVNFGEARPRPFLLAFYVTFLALAVAA